MCMTPQSQTAEQPSNRFTSAQTGPDPEKDIVPIEDLLMKLALAGWAIDAMLAYINKVAEFDGDSGGFMPPDHWAIIGASQNLMEVSHALKCACWGHEIAFLH